MAEMSVAVLARQLEVTQRRANQIVASGDIIARRTDSGEWLVDADSADAYKRRRRSTRGLSTNSAWALLFMLAGHRTAWTTESTRARLRRRIRTLNGEEIAREVAARTQIHRYRAANWEVFEHELLLTGRSAVEALATQLLPDRGRLYGYVPADANVQEWAKAHFMVADSDGNVFLFANTIPAAAATESIPPSVIAADLAISADARERAAGIEALEDLREQWLITNA